MVFLKLRHSVEAILFSRSAAPDESSQRIIQFRSGWDG